jgi:hypothetical protein
MYSLRELVMIGNELLERYCRVRWGRSAGVRLYYHDDECVEDSVDDEDLDESVISIDDEDQENGNYGDGDDGDGGERINVPKEDDAERQRRESVDDNRKSRVSRET